VLLVVLSQSREVFETSSIPRAHSLPLEDGMKRAVDVSLDSLVACSSGSEKQTNSSFPLSDVGASSQVVVDDSASSSASNSTPAPRKPASNVKRSKSATPRSASTSLPAPAPSSQTQTSGTPDSAARSTRRSNPINQRLEQLVYSSAIGGWDPEKGKYVSQVAARKSAGGGK
jgi:hypothetical protein